MADKTEYRYRVHRRRFRPDLVVLQKSAPHECTFDECGYGCHYAISGATYWVDVSPADLINEGCPHV